MTSEFDYVSPPLKIVKTLQCSEWQPIETAPKSCLHVIIAGRYANGHPYVEESYWDPRGHWSARKLEPPTHWMPLPKPPQSGE